MNPFDWTGGPFLCLYLGLLLVAVVAGTLIPRRLRPPGQPAKIEDPDALAWLAGGHQRLVDTVIARLMTRNALALVDGRKFAPKLGGQASAAVDRTVLNMTEPAEWGAIDARIRPHAASIERRLRGGGLLMSASELAALRFRSTLPYALLIAFGATKQIVGEVRDRPTGILTILLILTLIFAIIRWVSIDRRTRAGQALVADWQAASARMRRAPAADEFGMAVALFGTGVLAGSALDDLYRLRAANGSDSAGGGDTGSSGDGDGGGGGCGGCGS